MNDNKKKGQKSVGKKVLQTLGFLVGIAVLTLAGTKICMVTMELLKLPLTEDQLMGCTGSLGMLIAGLAIAIFMEKTQSDQELRERRERLSMKAIPMALLAISVIPVLWGSLLGVVMGAVRPVEANAPSGTTLIELIMVCLIGPIAEELLMRKGLYGFLRDRFPKAAALIVSSVLFAAIHGFGIQGATQAFLVGMVLAIAFEKTGNLWYSICIHMGLNLFSNVSNALVHSGVSFYTEPNGYVLYHWSVILVAVLAVAITMIVWLRKRPVAKSVSVCS